MSGIGRRFYLLLVSQSVGAAMVSYTGWFINNRNLFSTVLDAGSLGSWFQNDRFLLRILFRVADFLFILTWWKNARELSGSLYL